nr:hypothetical protein [Tanacetum cinerariifolium]
MAAGHSQSDLNFRRVRSSNEDFTKKISHSIYATNFPDSVNSRDLWNKYSVYGTVVDVFIPAKFSKADKRFAFVHFIKAFNLDRLVENLYTLWIVRYHLFANHVRFDRAPKYLGTSSNFPPLNEVQKPQGRGNNQFRSQKVNGPAASFVSVAKGVANPLISPSPALVVLADEGFEDVKLFYLEGRWVMFECTKSEAKRNLMKHIGINSWFHVIQEVPQDFVCKERVVWVDIEGIPLNAWTRDTFKKIGKKWGETLDIEDSSDSLFGRKRLRRFMRRTTIRFMVRINDVQLHSSDEEEEEGEMAACEVEGVAETVFGDNSVAATKNKSTKDDHLFADPFGIYEALKKSEVELKDPSHYLSHPPGFTPLDYAAGITQNQNIGEDGDIMNNEASPRISAKVILVDVKMEGYSFTWSHPSANKMSKLDRFLVSDGVISLFYSITAFCLDRHLSDHRPILLCEVKLDFGLGSLSFSDRNGMVRFKKKLQELKKTMRSWIKDKNIQLTCTKRDIFDEMRDIDKMLEAGGASDSLIFRRNDLRCQLQYIKSREAMDSMQKSKVKWAIEGDENTNFFHGPIVDLERGVSRDEIRSAVWDCGENKSPGPDGKYWNYIGPDFCDVVEHFFVNGSFSKGCNSSFVALIPKVTDAKFVNDYRSISLIGSVYKVVTKILVNRLAMVIEDLVSDYGNVCIMLTLVSFAKVSILGRVDLL